MVKNQSKAKNAEQKRSPDHGMFLPDEDREAFEAMEQEILKDLNADTFLLRRIASNIALVELDLVRHREMLAGLLRTAYVEQSAGVFDEGVPRKSLGLFSTAPDRQEFLDAIRTDTDEARQIVEKVLHEKGVSQAEILAAAIVERESAVNYHEMRIADGERRRRQLFADYERLRILLRPKPHPDGEPRKEVA